MTYRPDDSPFWYTDFADELGNRVRVSTRKRTKKEADVVEARMMSVADDIRHGHAVRERNPFAWDVAALAKWWWDEIASKQAQGRDGRLWGVVDKHIVKELGGLPLERVTPGVVNAWLRRKSETVSAGSLNHHRAYLMSMFSRAIELEKWRGQNPVKETERLATDDPEGKPLPPHYVWPLLLCAPTRGWLLVIAVAAYTGMRREEIARVFSAPGWPAVDLDERIIDVRKPGNANKKGRRVAIHADLAALLRRLRDEHVELPTASALTKSVDIVRNALLRAGIADEAATFHGLRGAWSDRMEECGARESVVDYMGWGKSTTSTRRRHYSRFTPDVLRAEIDKLRWPETKEG